MKMIYILSGKDGYRFVKANTKQSPYTIQNEQEYCVFKRFIFFIWPCSILSGNGRHCKPDAASLAMSSLQWAGRLGGCDNFTGYKRIQWAVKQRTSAQSIGKRMMVYFDYLTCVFSQVHLWTGSHAHQLLHTMRYLYQIPGYLRRYSRGTRVP